MLKLYIYGYKNQIRSSRKLAKNCKVNIEVKWLIGGVEPDYRTISEFRRKNAECLKKVFHEFNKRIDSAVEWGFILQKIRLMTELNGLMDISKSI